MSVYYGWVIVGVLALFSVMSVGLAGPNVAIFIDPMTKELGWSPATFGWAQMARLEAVIIAGPLLGRALDRFGPRFLFAFVGLGAAGLVVALSAINDEWQLIAIFAVSGLLGMGPTADLFVNAPVAKWFVRRRGLALGIALAGTPLGVAIFYPVSQLMIDAIGWRDAWLVFGIVGGAVIVPASLLFLRRQPEDMGLLPDGDTVVRSQSHEEPTEISWTRAEVVRTPRFWLLVAGFTLFIYGESTLALFRVPHFIERGLDPTLVAFAISVDAVLAIGVSVFLGRLTQQVAPRLVFLLGIGGLLLSAGALIVVDNIPLLFAANLAYGFGFQTGHVAQNVIWANYYGRQHLGAIRGLTLPVIFGVGATAFPVTGLIRSNLDTYTPAWVIAALVVILSGTLIVMIRPPQQPVASMRIISN